MPQIDHITLPSGTTYEICDSTARASQAGAIIIRGATTTALADEATTNPITINGESYTAEANDAVFYAKKEFVFDGTYWHEFGDMSGLGDLAQKDTASGNYTPEGTVSQPTFSGNSLSSTGTFTPSGSISATDNASGNYQPAGSVSAPSISVKTAGSTASVTPIDSVGSLPSLTMTVSNGTLEISFSQGSLPSAGSPVTVKTGDAVYEASAPSFTGTKVQLGFTGTEGSVSVSGTPSGTVSQPTFSGTAATITVS